MEQRSFWQIIDPLLGGIYIDGDMETEIDDGVKISDVLLDFEFPLPVYLGIDEISLLLVYFKPEYKFKLEMPIERLVNSIPQKMRPKRTFTAWAKFHGTTKNLDEKKLAIVQLICQAIGFMDWYFICMFSEIEIVQIMAAIKMAHTATLNVEKNTAQYWCAKYGIANP